MDNMKDTKSGKIIWLPNAAVMSAVICLVYFLFLYLIGNMTVIYDTAVSRAIVSGDMIGYPNPHLIFSNYVFGLVLSGLYRVLPAFNWYNIMLLFAMYFGLWAVLYRAMSLAQSRKFFGKLVAAALALILFNLFFFEELMSIYFLNTALIAGICGLFFFISADKLRGRDVVIIAVLLILCAGIRFSVFKELLPFLMLSAAVRFFVFKRRRYLLVLCAILAVAVGLMYIINAGAYTGEFAYQKEINSYRSAIQDYDGLPAYEGHEELYLSLGMDEDEYAVMKACWGLSDHFNVETLSAILEAIEEEYAGTAHKKEQVLSLVGGMFAKDYTKFFWFLEVLSFSAVFALTLYKKDRKMLLAYLTVLAAVVCEILYLAYEGRMPVRVTKLPLLALMVFAAAYIIQYRKDWAALFSSYRIVRLLSIAAAILCLCGWYTDSKAQYDRLRMNDIKTENQLKMVEYVLSDRNHVYFMHGMPEALDLFGTEKRNYTGWGGWISETEDWRTMLLGEYDNVWDAIAYRRELRFVVNDFSVTAMHNYMSSHGYDCQPVCETVAVDESGTIYKVWSFAPNGA